MLTLLRHVPGFLKLFGRLLVDRRVGALPKMALLLPLAYVILPVDLDFFPIIGQVDDLIVLIVGCRAFIRLCPAEVVEEHVRRIDAGT